MTKNMTKILLVEDDPFLIDIYRDKLSQAGFKVSIATDGKEALIKLKEEMPDLMLLDIVLPHIDGWEILRKIRKDENLKNLKVIILSNLGLKEEVEKGIKLGVSRYLIKAYYTPNQVVEEIKKVLKKTSNPLN